MFQPATWSSSGRSNA